MTGNSWYTVARTSDKECVGRVTFSLGSSELVFDVLIQFGNYSLSIVSASVTTVFAIRIRSYGGFSYVDLRADETIEGSPSVTIQQYLNTLSLITFALAGGGKQECIVSTDSYTPVIEETYVTIDQVETITARKYFADGLAIGDRDNNYVLTYGNDGVYMGNHRILTTVDGDTYVTTGSYNSTSKKIELKHGNTTVAEIDATAFIKDGMVDSVTVEDGYLVITFNTDAGKEPISIPLSGFSDDFVTLTTAQTITGIKKHKSIALLNIPMSAPLSGDMESGKSYLYVGTGAYAEEASGGGGGGGGETLTILRNGTQVATYNGSTPVSANILVPTTVASLSDASDYATKIWVENKGYITSAALSGYVTIATDQIITGAKYFSNALAIPLSAPSSPTSGLSYLYAGSGSYAEEPGGGVADVYPLTITKNGSSWLYYDPGEEAVSVNLSVPTKVSDLTNDTGFITSSALNGYATQTWVEGKGYITSSALSGYVNDFEVTGNGNAVTAGSKSGSKITLTKGNTFVDLTSAQIITGAKKHANVALLNIPTSISSSDIESGKVYLYSGSGEYAEEASGGVADVYPLYLVIGGTTTTYDPASESTTVTFGSAAKKGYTTSITQGSSDLPTSGAVYSAIAAAVTSALHYRGMSSTALTDGGTETATIGGVALTPQSGDVVIYGGFEFLWENNVWNKLGDDSSYALKTVQITAGTGLTGGGDLTASRTLSLSSATQTDIGKGVTAYNSLSNYLPLAGNSTSNYVTGPVYFNPGNDSCVIKNIFYNTTTGWSRDVVRLAVDGTNKFTIGAYGSYIQGGSSNGLEYAYIGCNAYNGLNLRITSDSLKWGSNVIYHAGNLTKSVLTTILDSDGGYYLKLTGGTLTGTLNARDILPSATTTYALGSSSKKWNEVWGTKAHISSLLAIPTSAPSSGDIVSGEAYLYSSTGSYSQTPSGGVADVYPLTITKNGSAWLYYNPGVQAESINLSIPTKVSDLTNDTGFITASSIPSTYAWSAITNTPTTLSGYGITDAKIETPSGTSNRKITLGSNNFTIYSWALASAKPSYTLDEVADGSTRKLANYLPLAGNAVASKITGNVVLGNNVFLQGVHTNGTAVRELIGLDNNNIVTVGCSTNQICLLTSSVDIKHNKNGTLYSVYDESNLSLATLAGSSAIGSTSKPVYYNGSSLVACGTSLTDYLPLSGGTITSTGVKPLILNSTHSSSQSSLRLSISGTEKAIFGYQESYNVGAYLQNLAVTDYPYVNIASDGKFKYNNTYEFYHTNNLTKSVLTTLLDSNSGYYLPLTAGSSKALTGDLYFDATSAHEQICWKYGNNQGGVVALMATTGHLYLGYNQITKAKDTYIEGANTYISWNTSAATRQAVFAADYFRPSADDTLYLGHPSYRWKAVYAKEVFGKLGTSTESDATFTYRAVPSVAVGDVARVTKVKGKTIVWNQLVTNGNFANGTSRWTSTTSINTIAATGGILTSTMVAAQSRNLIYVNVDVLNGHKYLVRFQTKWTTAVTASYFVGYMSNPTQFFGTIAATDAANWTTAYGIFTADSDKTILRIGAYGSTKFAIGDTIQYRNVGMFDLTLMFGAGNEPSTVAEFEALYPLPYYDYNAGELVNNAASGVEMLDAGGNSLGTIPLNITGLTSGGMQIFLDGMKSAGSVADEWSGNTATKRIESRAYQSGDENDGSVVTDKTTTYYPLTTPVTYTTDQPLPGTLAEFDNGGTQRRLPVDTTSEVIAPMVCDFQYGANMSDVAKAYLPLSGGTVYGTLEASGELIIPDHAPYQPEPNKHYLYVDDNGNYYQS